MDILRRDGGIPNQGPKIETVSLILASLSVLAVSARLYRRLGMSGSSFSWDDAAISFALVRDSDHTTDCRPTSNI